MRGRRGALRLSDERSRLSVAVLVSGSGSNLQALIDAAADSRLAASVDVVLSNNPGAYGLLRAQDAGIPTIVLDHRDFATRGAYDAALADALREYSPDLVALAGFMRILGPQFVDAFSGRILNIHPSLLPRYPGLNTHQRALDAGDPVHGCTVHYVTATLDGGPAIMQGQVEVLDGDTAKQLAQRVLAVEHRIYAAAIALIAAGRLRYRDNKAWLDDEMLETPLRYPD
ncbi:MAG: phosphoribosylglycinamide formyltransferase [Gammaproteobacteria bacterium]|nr:phosphoribosylglycinamide formyltransferase [Gammaproteobacteria bacterium]